MNTYNLIVDSKVSVWQREHVAVEAETLEEAIQRCLDEDYDNVSDTEDLYDTVERLNPNNVNGPTLEIYKPDDLYSLLYTNKPSK